MPVRTTCVEKSVKGMQCVYRPDIIPSVQNSDEVMIALLVKSGLGLMLATFIETPAALQREMRTVIVR